MTRAEADDLLQDMLEARDQYFNNPLTEAKSIGEHYHKLRDKVLDIMMGERQ